MLVLLVVKFNRAGTKSPRKETGLWLMKWPIHLTSLLIENRGTHGTQVSFAHKKIKMLSWLESWEPFLYLYSYITRWTKGCRDCSWRCFHSPLCDRDLAWSVLLWNHHQTATQSNQNSWHHQTGTRCPENVLFDWLHWGAIVQLASVSSEIGTADSRE